MSRWSQAQKASLAQTCAASMFNSFADVSCRGPAWTPEMMYGIVRNWAETQAFVHNVPKKAHKEVAAMAVDFYKLFLDKPMRMIR